MRKAKKNIKLTILLNGMNKFIGQDMKTIYNELRGILKQATGKADIIPLEELKTDRDFLDVSIEAYSFLYCLANNLSYEKREHEKKILSNKFFDYLMTYKLENYRYQIFNEMGYHIEKITKEGIRFREMTNEEKEAYKKLN